MEACNQSSTNENWDRGVDYEYGYPSPVQQSFARVAACPGSIARVRYLTLTPERRGTRRALRRHVSRAEYDSAAYNGIIFTGILPRDSELFSSGMHCPRRAVYAEICQNLVDRGNATVCVQRKR